MTKHLLAGAAAIVLISGVASAQTYVPAPPPPPGVAVAPALPPAPPPGSPIVVPKPKGDHGEVTIHKEVDENGNKITEKEIHREGVSGSTETHIKKEKKAD